MEKEILDVIKKNLPAEVGETLRKVLEKASQDAECVARQAALLRQHEATIEKMNADLNKHSALDRREAELDTREKGITLKEDKMNVWEAQLRLAESEKRANEIAGFTALMLKSPIIRKTIIENDMVGFNYNNGGSIPYQQGKTKTVEESHE